MGLPRPDARRRTALALVRRLLPLLVAVLAVLPFLPALSAGFVLWDDDRNFLENPAYRGLGWTHLVWAFTTFHMGLYIPVTWLTLALDHALWGMAPRGYHLTSLAFHGVNAALVFLVARRILGGDRAGAALAALLFAVHPLRVESVVWVTERRDVVSGLAGLVALLAYLRYARGGGRRAAWYLAALSAFGLALFAKPIVVTLPVVLVLLDLWPLGRLARDPRRWLRPGPRRVLAEKIPFLALAAAAAAIAVRAQQAHGALASLADLGWAERLAISAHGLAFYLGRSLLPAGLSPLYELPPRADLLGWRFGLAAGVVLAVTGLVLLAGRRWPAAPVAWAAYVVSLLPVLGLVHNGPQIAADRYTYLATLPLALLAGGAAGIAARRARHAGGPVRLAVPALATLILATLGTLAWQQSRVWRDSETLWRHAVTVTPSPTTHQNLGATLVHAGRPAEAAEHFRAALRLNPAHAKARTGLGTVLLDLGQVDEAERHFREALRIRPDLAEAHNGLGTALAARGDQEGAIQAYRAALHLDTAFARALSNWGAALARLGRHAEAIERFRAALSRQPDLAEAHANLGAALVETGSPAEGVEHLRRAVGLAPGDAAARYNLGAAALRLERWEEAAAHFEQALALRPGFAEARRALATARARLAR